MRADRLLRLADHLDTLTDSAFDMSHWGVWNPHGCGTVCCALGHACSIPEFAAAGLRLSFDRPYDTPDKDDIAEVCLHTPRGWLIGFTAAQEFFGITYEQATHLFAPDTYFPPDTSARERDYAAITRAQVAARIRELVAKGGA